MNAIKCLAITLLAVALPAVGQHAADRYHDPAAMAAARETLREEMGGQSTAMVLGDRLEYRSNEGDPVLLWDLQARYGGDIDRLQFKTEGEYLTDEDEFEEAEFQGLYSRAVSPYFDLQLGYRYDAKPEPERHFAVLGVQGLAPYWFEVDAAAFLSEEGDVSARLEAEYDLLLTQRLVLQPRIEVELAAQDVAEAGVGSGLGSTAIGLRLRYEILREFAPYVGLSWHRAYGDTRDLGQLQGEDPDSLSFVAGVRFWF